MLRKMLMESNLWLLTYPHFNFQITYVFIITCQNWCTFLSEREKKNKDWKSKQVVHLPILCILLTTNVTEDYSQYLYNSCYIYTCCYKCFMNKSIITTWRIIPTRVMRFTLYINLEIWIKECLGCIKYCRRWPDKASIII